MRSLFFALLVLNLAACARHTSNPLNDSPSGAPPSGSTPPPGTTPSPAKPAGGQGTDIGSGIETPLEEVAWFQGADRVIRACFISAKPGMEKRFREVIEGAYTKWRHYVQTRLVHWRLPVEARVAVNVDLRDSCRGDEEITFYFGVETPFIDKWRNRLRDPLALAARDGSRGAVWVKERDFMADSLEVILLHEIGHTLGNGHVKGTIMDAHLTKRLSLIPDSNGKLAQIDHTRELVEGPLSYFRGSFEAKSPVSSLLYAQLIGLKLTEEQEQEKLDLVLERRYGTWKRGWIRDVRGYAREFAPNYLDDRTESWHDDDPHRAFNVQHKGYVHAVFNERHSVSFHIPQGVLTKGGRIRIDTRQSMTHRGAFLATLGVDGNDNFEYVEVTRVPQARSALHHSANRESPSLIDILGR